MKIGNLLFEQQKSFFVGREKELELFEQYMSDPTWKLLHIHGPGGIGKTTLIQLFAQYVSPCRYIYLDGHSDNQCPHDFLAHIRHSLPHPTDSIEETEMLDDYALQHNGVVLFLDTFEKWGAIEDWLRIEWFPKLSPLVKICSAGRYPLEDQWIRNGWHLFIQNIELKPLSFDEIQAYANNRGVQNQEIISSLHRFSNGLPLALSMACEIIIRKGNTLFLDQQQKNQIITYLVAELTRDIGESHLERYTEAASMVWRFDHELLQSLLQESVPIDHFREFCRLPFVIRQADNWSLHDSIRQWVFTDLRSRMPGTFQIYRRHALEALIERESLLPHKKMELAFERLYLHELDFVRDFRFQWDDCLRFRECREQELELVEQLYLEYLHYQTNFLPGESHLESLIRPLWEIDPSAFYGLWRDKELVAFCSCILLTEQTVQLFRTNPITAPITSRYNPSHRQYLLCITGVATHLEQDITGSVARALVNIIERNNDAEFLDLISVPYWLQYLPLLGFQRVPWADSTTPLGVRYMGHQLDLRHEGISSRLNRMYSMINSTASLEQMMNVKRATETKLSVEEAAKLIQRALKHFPRLPLYPEITHNMLPLLSESSFDMETERIAQLVQDKIRDVLQQFLDGSEEERRFYRILQNAYIKKIGTHEVVSEYLNIPIKSYYRYLQSAVRSLAYEMIKAKP